MPFMNIGPGRIEYDRIASDNRDAATFVMLHEGLGSVSMWKDFPVQLARATGNHVVVYSRHGYGRSAPVRASRTVRYMHDEALVVLPRFLGELGIENPILLGHSDGASIALIHAGGSGRAVGGIVALAPHVMVEDISVSSIAAAKFAYQSTNMRERLARYHDDVDGAFWAWNDMWLHPAFRTWNIEEYLPRIRCRVLAIQGEEDEYGSMEQIERIARAAPEVETQKFANCGHSPHRDQAEAVLLAVAQWTERYRARESAARHASAATRDPA